MVELNNRNALLRIYSRMVSASFIALSVMMPFFMSSSMESIAGLAFLLALFVLLFSYQDKLSMGKTFYTFALLSAGSIFDVHLLYYVPLIWMAMAFYLQTMSWRNFCASIIGVATPYWFAAAVLLYVGNPMAIVAHLSQLFEITIPPDFGAISLGAVCSIGWIAVLVIIGTVHFVRNSYMDSIRIRMIFYTFIFLSILTMAFIVLVPTSLDLFARVAVVVASPLIAHFLSLTHTRATNVAFVVVTLTTFAITVFNLWMQSFPF